MPIVSTFATMAASTVASVYLSEYLRGRLRSREKEKVAGTMSGFEIVGFEDDDDVAGSIGADEDALMQALSVSGLGGSEIVGADIIGAVASRNRQQQIRAKNQKLVVRKTPTTDRRCPLGFVPTSVGAGATLNIPGAPQNLFRPERLVVPSDIASDFGIVDIKVGNTSQFVQNVEIPASLFSEVAINTAVQFDSAEVGNQISISVRNKSAAAIEFSAGAVGTIAK